MDPLNIRFRLFISAAMLCLACFGSATTTNAQTELADQNRKPVLVELFTSEGCSSCPPADLLLQKLIQQQPVANAQIIAFEEHVDYWDRQGWVDPFSAAEWTQRQQSYGALAQSDVYTPELIVDGRSQFVGNDPQRAEIEIAKAARNAKTEVAIAAQAAESKGSQRFSVSVGKLPPISGGDVAEVWLAVTEDGLHSSVSRGENEGHVLQHAATLRSLHKLGEANATADSVSFSSEPVVKFNSRWNAANLHVTVFVQQKKNKEILGAATAKVKG